MWKRTAFRKGANLFLGRNQPVFGGLLPGFLCSKSVREIICFSGRMTGGIFRENQRIVCRFNFGVGITPAKWHFQSRRRFCWLWSAGEVLPVGRQKTKKAETAVNATAPAYKNSTQNFLDFYIKIGIQKFLRAFISNLWKCHPTLYSGSLSYSFP